MHNVSHGFRRCCTWRYFWPCVWPHLLGKFYIQVYTAILICAQIYIIFVTIILICLGRYPWRQVNPEIGKLSKTVVERIPLVVYIPPPPEGAAFTTPHSYPPKTTIANRPQPRFKFLRSFRNKKYSASDVASDEKNETIDAEGPISWEAHWEPAEYPFVALEGNRAACVICLMDFEEPKRKEISSEGSSIPNKTEHRTISNMTSKDIPSGEMVQKELRLEDAGDGVQPLRLLPCGHVFHVCPFTFHLSFAGVLIVGNSENMFGSLAHSCIRTVSPMSTSGESLQKEA